MRGGSCAAGWGSGVGGGVGISRRAARADPGPSPGRRSFAKRERWIKDSVELMDRAYTGVALQA